MTLDGASRGNAQRSATEFRSGLRRKAQVLHDRWRLSLPVGNSNSRRSRARPEQRRPEYAARFPAPKAPPDRASSPTPITLFIGESGRRYEAAPLSNGRQNAFGACLAAAITVHVTSASACSIRRAIVGVTSITRPRR